MKKFLVPFLIVFSLSTIANAGLLLEPYFDMVLQGKSRDAADTKFSGSYIGGRVGWGMLGFAIGLDIPLAGTVTGKDDSGSLDLKPSGVGVFAAYSFPILVRGYLSYFPTYNLKSDLIDLSGTNMKLGVQYTGLPFVAIGLESETFNQKKINSTENDNVTTLTNIVISAPFNL